MAQEASTLKIPSAGADYDTILEQLAALREDLQKLAGSVSSAASHRKQALSRDVSEGVTEAARYAGRKGHDVEARMEHAVTAYPLRAFGLSVAVGLLLLGVLWRR